MSFRFKPGDKVRRNRKRFFHPHIKHGEIYTVNRYSRSTPSIELKEEEGYFWNDRYFELVESMKDKEFEKLWV